MNAVAVKVCGMRDEENLKALVALQPDFLGLIFYKGSKRFVGVDFRQDIVSQIPSSIRKVGVFVNSSTREILEYVDKYQLEFAQLHGNETPEQCRELQKQGVRVIKAFALFDEFDFGILDQYEPFVDYFLFDTKGKEYGGNGMTFNWEILQKYHLGKPFFLSGGLDIVHIDSLKSINSQALFALDLNSKFEVQPGLKDIDKLKLFFKKLKRE